MFTQNTIPLVWVDSVWFWFQSIFFGDLRSKVPLFLPPRVVQTRGVVPVCGVLKHTFSPECLFTESGADSCRIKLYTTLLAHSHTPPELPARHDAALGWPWTEEAKRRGYNIALHTLRTQARPHLLAFTRPHSPRLLVPPRPRSGRPAGRWGRGGARRCVYSSAAPSRPSGE